VDDPGELAKIGGAENVRFCLLGNASRHSSMLTEPVARTL
jgi:hypothetical protein